MKHTHQNIKFTWKIYKPHGRPPRLHVQCSYCKEKYQTVPDIDGVIRSLFKTGKSPSGKKGRYIRLTDKGYKEVQRQMKAGEIQ